MNQIPDAARGQWRWDGQRYVTADGRWWWDGRQWQPMPAQQQQPPPPGARESQQRINPHRVVVQPRKPMTKGAKVALAVIASVCVLFVIIIGVAAQSGGNGQQQPQKKAAATEATSTPKATPTPTPVPTPKPTPKPPTPPPAPVQLVDAMGNGSGETGPFDTNGHFKVNYSFDCSGMYGGSGNFIVTPVDANGNDLAGPEVNRLAANGNGTADGYTFGSQKQMHLQIVSECTWHVTVTTA